MRLEPSGDSTSDWYLGPVQMIPTYLAYLPTKEGQTEVPTVYRFLIFYSCGKERVHQAGSKQGRHVHDQSGSWQWLER